MRTKRKQPVIYGVIMRRKTKAKMKVVREKGTAWITVKGTTWIRNGYPETHVDKFDDVWLKPYKGAPNLYTTVQTPQLLFGVKDGYLVEED